LRNESSYPGGFLKVYLVGVDSSRDAIGAVVRLRTTSGDVYQKQLVAGDGFQASNERVLHFGLGAATGIAELHVRWPSGKQQNWSGLECNRELLIRESGDLIQLARGSESLAPLTRLRP
jgi:hypothetical protein